MYSSKVVNGLLEVFTSGNPFVLLRLEYTALSDTAQPNSVNSNSSLFNRETNKFIIPVDEPYYHVKLYNGSELVYETIAYDEPYLIQGFCSTIDDVVLGTHIVYALINANVSCNCDLVATAKRYLRVIEQYKTDCYGCG